MPRARQIEPWRCALFSWLTMGNIIDKTKTRWGRFKPWVIVGAFVAAITLALLFTDFGGMAVSNSTLYLILFAIVYFVMDVFYSAKDVAIWSMIPALSFDSHEREITATVARIGSVFGGQLVTIMVMPIVLYFSVNQNGGAGDPTGWFAFACIGGGIAVASAASAALGAISEDSSALGKSLIFVGLAEGVCLYGLIISFMILGKL